MCEWCVVFVCVCMCMCGVVCVCMFVCMYICVCVSVHACMCDSLMLGVFPEALHLLSRGRVSHLSPDLTDLVSIASQFVPGIL